MKVAVCVGGITYPDTLPLMDKLRKKFPDCDFFFGVWKGRENTTSRALNAWSFEEHEPTYHPYLDMDPTGLPSKFPLIQDKMRRRPDLPMRQKAFHQTKQIIMHSYMLDKLPPEYDMIIRTRFDINFIDDMVDFYKFLNEAYSGNKAVGLSKRFRSMPPILRARGDAKWNHWWEGFIQDLIIFHPRQLFDTERMWQLHKDKKLLAAEFGWYQVLSQPYGDTHESYFCNISITSRDGTK